MQGRSGNASSEVTHEFNLSMSGRKAPWLSPSRSRRDFTIECNNAAGIADGLGN